MPYTNVHLRIARSIVRMGFPVSDAAAFYAGSIAPDAVHLLPDYEPMLKAKAHLAPRWAKGIDKQAWRQTILDSRERFRGGDFLTGYALHLLTDVRWAERLDLTFIARYEADGGEKPPFMTAYRRNMLACEAELRRRDLLPEVWEALDAYHDDGFELPIREWIASEKAMQTQPAVSCRMYVSAEEVFAFTEAAAGPVFREWTDL